MIKTILFDADDTLWHDSHYFQKLQNFVVDAASKIGITEDNLMSILTRNMKLAGMGEKNYTIALLKTVEELPFETSFTSDLQVQIDLFLDHPVELFDNVETILSKLAFAQRILLTKGRYNEQIRKVIKSQLLNAFDNIIVLDKKNSKNLKALLELFNLIPADCLLIGNSLRHDIIPAVENSISCIWYNHEHNEFGRNDTKPIQCHEANNWNDIYDIIVKLNND